MTIAPSPHETSGPPVLGDLDSFPSHAELARTLVGSGGIATLATLTESGHPYNSIAPFSMVIGGSPLICVSDLAEHTQNLRRDPRSSLLISAATIDGVDPLALARVTLIGTFVPDTPSEAAIAGHLDQHPFARHYIDFDDFSWWRFEPLRLRYVGGFGVMGWASAAEFAAATCDPVIPHAAPMVEHLNADHADACASIVRCLGDVPDATSATVASVDRYGMTFDAQRIDGSTAIGRVAFPDPLTSPGQVRGASVALVRQAQEVSAT